MKRIISLVFVTLMFVNIAVSGVSAVRYIDDDFSALHEDWWVYGGFSPEIDKGYLEGYSDAVILQTAYDNSQGDTNMQGMVWDQCTVKADMILLEAEQDDPHCGIWYADYSGVINPATGLPSEARNANKFYIWYYPLTGTFTVERETNEEGSVILYTSEENKNYKYKLEEGDDPVNISLGYRVEKGKISFYVDDKFLYETEFESIGTHKAPIVFWNRGLHLRFDRVIVGDLDEMYLPKPPVTPGDLNGDDKINLVDVVLLIRYQAGWENLGINEEAADFDGDGSVGMKDIILLLRSLA